MHHIFFTILLIVFSFSTSRGRGVESHDSIISKFQNPLNTDPFIIAHRGDWRSAPENSLLAIQKAIDMDIDMVEIDVRKTKDGQFVLMHDEAIDRTTNGTGKVWELSWDYLKTLNLKDNEGVITSYKIPTLEETLDLAKGQIMLNLDKSYGYIDEIYPLLKEKKVLDQVVFKGWMKPLDQVRSELNTPLDSIIFIPIISIDENGWQEILTTYEDYALSIEVLFKSSSKLESSINILKNSSAQLWVNTMWDFMSGGRDDEAALTDPNGTYGWLYEKGFTVFQTDRPALMNNYFKSSHRIASDDSTFYLGADLSYVNEMDDCGAQYFEDGQQKDIYEIFSEHQANIVRYRLWHDPDSINGYSFLKDVKRNIARAKSRNMHVLLDFHYSDVWADPGRQWRPRAWDKIEDDKILADSLYHYTFNTLEELLEEDLLPDFVQIGNETNGNILQKISSQDLRDKSPNNYPLNWSRQVDLLQHGINAVTSFNQTHGQSVRTIIHVAQPENIDWWFSEAIGAGLHDFDVIGLSYYPQHSDYTIRQVGNAIASFKQKFDKEVMVVEVAYPWTGTNTFFETRVNPHTPQGQKDFMVELSYLVKENGGLGVVYWEPAWVDTECETLWGTGSTHDEFLFFDHHNQLLPTIEFFEYDYSQVPIGVSDQEVTFKVDMTGIESENGVYITGDFTGNNRKLLKMNKIADESDIYQLVTKIPGRSKGRYAFYKSNELSNKYLEPVPIDCSVGGNRRAYVIQGKPTEYFFAWGRCDSKPEKILTVQKDQFVEIYPNPSAGVINLDKVVNEVSIWSMDGRLVKRIKNIQKEVDVSFLRPGHYLIKIPLLHLTKKLIIK